MEKEEEEERNIWLLLIKLDRLSTISFRGA